MFGRAHHTAPASRLDVLRRLPMFENFSDAELETIDALCCQTIVEPGETLITQGRMGRQAFIVISGVAEVRIDGEVVAHLHAGDVVGEMALLDKRPRTATVIALTPLDVFVVNPGEFAALFSDPRTARWIAASIARRLRDLEQNDLLASVTR